MEGGQQEVVLVRFPRPSDGGFTEPRSTEVRLGSAEEEAEAKAEAGEGLMTEAPIAAGEGRGGGEEEEGGGVLLADDDGGMGLPTVTAGEYPFEPPPAALPGGLTGSLEEGGGGHHPIEAAEEGEGDEYDFLPSGALLAESGGGLEGVGSEAEAPAPSPSPPDMSPSPRLAEDPLTDEANGARDDAVLRAAAMANSSLQHGALGNGEYDASGGTSGNGGSSGDNGGQQQQQQTPSPGRRRRRQREEEEQRRQQQAVGLPAGVQEAYLDAHGTALASMRAPWITQSPTDSPFAQT